MNQVISGGQTGVDLAALRAAKGLGIRTGGWMPKGFWTQEGYKPEYRQYFGMREHSSPHYPPRTFCNVQEADATVRIARDFESAGEKLTLKAIRQYRKPYLDIAPRGEAARLARWLVQHGFEVVNFAGNSERTAPGIGREAYRMLVSAFQLVLKVQDENRR